jgi:chromosome segregation ATPase
MDTAIPLSLDTATFTVNEIRTDPNSRWYDHKSYSSGFVSLSCSRLSIKVTSLTRHCLLTQLQKYEFSLSTKKPQIAWTNGPFPGSKHEREQNVSLQKELGDSLGSLQKMEESTELLRLEKDKAEMERSNAQRRIDQLEDQICGLLSSGKDIQYQLEREREQNVSLQKELGDSLGSLQKMEESTELLRLEKDKAEMERSNAQRRIDQLEDQICGLLSSGKDFRYQLEWEREQNVSLQKELGDSRCEIERLREAGNELQHLLTSHLQQLESQIERAHANTVTIEQEKEKMVDRCFETVEQLAEATALQSEMQKQLLLSRQREDEMLVERTARELEIQQLQVQNTSLAEKQAELEKEVVYFKLQVERIMDELFIDNMPPLVCDENVPCVEDELMEVERSEKNPKRKRKY